MISIIISNYQENKFIAIKKNLKSTIGNVEYEVIRIFNPGLMGMGSAYNRGAILAKFPYLLFIHDDIEFRSINWGKELLECFEIKNLGIIGLAGGRKKFKLPTGHDVGIRNYRASSVIHSKNEEMALASGQPLKVKTLDGVFLALTKVRWEELKFNEAIRGFHFYDLDISMRASVKYLNFIAPNISVLHFSKGNFNNEWVKSSLKFHKGSYNFDSIKPHEKKMVKRFWYKRLVYEDISFDYRIKFLIRMGIDRSSIKEAFKFLFEKKAFNF